MIKILSLIFFFTTSILAFSVELDQRSPGDNIWSGCKNVSYAGISINNACILLTEGTDCSLDVTFTIAGTEVLSQNMDLSVVPEVCGSYSGCDYCLTIGINPDDTSQRCVTVSPKCGIFQLPTITAGCFPNSALANLISCQQNKCPNDCNGHGTCNAGVCTCDTGFYGEDCNSTGDLFHQCERLDQIGADVCARVKFEPCNLVVEILLEGNGQEMTLFSQEYPVQTFKQVFQNDAQCADTGVCKLCLKWSDLTLTEIEAHGCGSLELTCLGVTYPYTLGCFDDNEVVPQCFGTCPKNCSYNGYCYRGACQCEDDWQGEDCGTPREYCPHYCSGHGTCNKLEGVCTCDNGYSGTDCSRVVPPPVASSGAGKPGVTIVVILVPVCVVVVIGVVAVAIWYVRKQKKNAGPQFHQLDLLEDDQEGLMEEME